MAACRDTAFSTSLGSLTPSGVPEPGVPHPFWAARARAPAAPCLPAAQVPAWRTRTPCPGTAAHNRKLGRAVGCHGGAGDPSTTPVPRLPPGHPLSSPSSLEISVARDSDSPGKCGRTRSSMVTVASELKAEEMVLGRRGSRRGLGQDTPTTAPGPLTHLRAPLKRQATKSPGSPGRSCSTSITKSSTSCGRVWQEVNAGVRAAGDGHGRWCLTHLVRGGRAWCQRVLPVIDKHDEASEAAEAEHDLLAGEHGVAGAAGATWVSGVVEWGGGPSQRRLGTPSPSPTHSLASRSLRALR